MRYIVFCVLLVIGFLEVKCQEPPNSFTISSTQIRVKTSYVTSQFKVLRGRINDSNLAHNTPAIIGRLKKGDVYTTFTPAVPLDQETPYTLICNDQIFHLEIARPVDSEALSVIGIYPSSNKVPANILKWYIEFSQAVNPVKIYEHITFLDQEGKPIDRSILNLGAPLLSEDGTLLTVWIEPGRQKRLLGPNQRLGSVFEPYRQYTLQIASTLKDTNGRNIEKSWSHVFETIEADRMLPNPSEWNIIPLQSETLAPLEISCNDQLDYGSLIDAFNIRHDGQSVKGSIKYDSENAKIYFTPQDEWKKGSYTAHIDYRLEDLAGNNLHHLFNRPLEENRKEIVTEEFILDIPSQ